MNARDPSARVTLLPADAPFSPAQRAWLDGFFAAVLTSMPTAPPGASAAVPAAPTVTLNVLHASQTGTAESLARKLVKAAKQKGYAAQLHELSAWTPEQFAGGGIALIIASTYGEGAPPDPCVAWPESFANPPAADAAAWSAVRYAVLALGDSSYRQFCAFGHFVDDRLAAYGATRLLPCTEVDGATDKPFGAWQQALWPTLPEAGSATPGGPGSVGDSGVADVAAAEEEEDAHASAPYHRDKPFGATLLGNLPLNGPGSDKDTRHVILSLAGSGLRYTAGDALGVWPRNPVNRVQVLLQRLGQNGEATVLVDARPMSLREALSGQREIGRVTMPVALRYLRRLGSFAPGDVHTGAASTASAAGPAGARAIGASAETLSELFSLAEPESTPALQAFVDGKDAADLFGVVPGAPFSSQDIVDILAPLAPRLYSISSSQDAHPDEVHLTVGVVQLAGYLDDPRYGIASYFLSRDDRVRDTVPVYIHPNPRFRLPLDPATPVVMIGPGTGIAPFRAFLEQRAAMAASGPAWLFYGDRRRAHDYLYEAELQAFIASGTLTRIDAAFSRDGAPKEYVQHRMKAAGADLWKWIQEGAHIYVCGDAKHMAVDVDAALLQILMDYGKLTSASALVELRHMSANGRYARDVY